MSANPYAPMFDVQRAAIEGARTAAESGLALSRTATGAAVQSLDTTRSVHASRIDLSRRAAHAYLDAVEEAGGVEGGLNDVRSLVDEQFEAVDEFNDEAWDAVERSAREFESSVEELNDAQSELIESTFDAVLRIQADAEAAADEAGDAASGA